MTEIELLISELDDVKKQLNLLQQRARIDTRSEPAGTSTVGELTQISDGQLDDDPNFYIEHPDGGMRGTMSQLTNNVSKNLVGEKMPRASTDELGVTLLSNATDSQDETLSATSKAVNDLSIDLSDKLAEIPSEINPQSWQPYTSERILMQEYVNDTNKVIQVAVEFERIHLNMGNAGFSVDGVQLGLVLNGSDMMGHTDVIIASVPPSSTYKATGSSTYVKINRWSELR